MITKGYDFLKIEKFIQELCWRDYWQLIWSERGEDIPKVDHTGVTSNGTKKGFDYELIKKVSESVSIPVIASGGMGEHDHLNEVVKESCADAVAMADILHYERSTIQEIREYCIKSNINVRDYE